MSLRAAETVSGSSGGRRGDAVAGALGDEQRLEVRDRTEDVEYELAGGRGSIEALLECRALTRFRLSTTVQYGFKCTIRN